MSVKISKYEIKGQLTQCPVWLSIIVDEVIFGLSRLLSISENPEGFRGRRKGETLSG